MVFLLYKDDKPVTVYGVRELAEKAVEMGVADRFVALPFNLAIGKVDNGIKPWLVTLSGLQPPIAQEENCFFATWHGYVEKYDGIEAAVRVWARDGKEAVWLAQRELQRYIQGLSV